MSADDDDICRSSAPAAEPPVRGLAVPLNANHDSADDDDEDDDDDDDDIRAGGHVLRVAICGKKHIERHGSVRKVEVDVLTVDEGGCEGDNNIYRRDRTRAMSETARRIAER